MSELQNLKENDYYNAFFERYTSLKSYKFIAKSKNTLKFTERGLEFLKHDDKEYYLGKILIMDKYKRTSRPDVFIESYKQFFLLKENEQKELIYSVLHRCDTYENESYENNDPTLDSWSILDKNIKEGLDCEGHAPCENRLRICGDAFSSIVVGLKPPISVSIEKLIKIFNDLIQLKNTFSQVKKDQTKFFKIRDK